MAWILGVENGVSPASFSWGATLPAGFTDITADVVQLDACGAAAIGGKRTRDLIKSAVLTETNMLANWATYPANKQAIAIKWMVVPYSFRVPAITEQEDISNWLWVAEFTKQGRAEIIEMMRLHVSDYLRREVLTKDDLDAFWYDTVDYIDSYIAGNSPDLKDWLTNAAGTQFETNGFEQKSYWSQQLEDELINIYNGEY